MPGVGTFLYEQLFVKPVLPVLPEVGLSGRTVIVTGSNVGLGVRLDLSYWIVTEC